MPCAPYGKYTQNDPSEHHQQKIYQKTNTQETTNKMAKNRDMTNKDRQKI